jgi:hypothetical protein
MATQGELHQKYQRLDAIEDEMRQAMIRISRVHNLTRAETLDLYTRVLSDKLLLISKYMLKEEYGE